MQVFIVLSIKKSNINVMPKRIISLDNLSKQIPFGVNVKIAVRKSVMTPGVLGTNALFVLFRMYVFQVLERHWYRQVT